MREHSWSTIVRGNIESEVFAILILRCLGNIQVEMLKRQLGAQRKGLARCGRAVNWIT